MGWGGVGWGVLLTSFLLTTFNYVTNFCHHLRGVGWLWWHNLQLRCYLLFQSRTTSSTLVTQIATTLSTLLTQVATTCHLLDEFPAALLTFITQLATRLLSSRSSSNYVVDFYYTTCNYVVDSCDTTCDYVRCYLQKRIGHFTWVCEPPPWGSHAKRILRQGKTCLSYWYYWCSMVCIKELHSQKIVPPKQQKTIETLKRIFWRKNMLFFRLHKHFPMKMSC